MKFCLLLAAAALMAPAQAPQSFAPETVVATVDGKDVTYGELRHALQSYPPQLMQTFQHDPREALRQLYIIRYTAAEGDKLKLGESDPWKEQIDILRESVVSSAFFNDVRNKYQVSVDDIEAYYKVNQHRYEQAAIKIIKIAFKPGASGPASLEDLAKLAVQSAHAANDRSEADARKLAADIVKQLRSGADFGKMAAQYSDDAESKAAGGDYGTVRPNSPYTDDFKKAVLALKPGEISEPILAGQAFYIARVESKSVQPVDKLREQIMDDIKDAHFREYLTKLQERFTPEIKRPDIMVQINGSLMQQKK